MQVSYRSHRIARIVRGSRGLLQRLGWRKLLQWMGREFWMELAGDAQVDIYLGDIFSETCLRKGFRKLVTWRRV